VRLLVDTHCWLWQLASPERLNPEAAALLTDPENELWLSVASVWEIIVKAGLGKLDLGGKWV
jgi:PIN domain nuclease of toxin-antitoxin system